MNMALAASAHHAFWSSTLVLVVVACALPIGLTVALLLSRRQGRGDVRARVGEFVSPAVAPDDAHAGPERLTRMLTRTERSLEGERWWDEFKTKVELARIERPAIEIVYLTAASSVIGAGLLFALTGNPVAALPAFLLGPLATRALVNHRLRRQRIRFSDQLPSHLQELAAAMRAGHSMVSGIAVMADGASEPSRGEFRRVIADEQLGLPLSEALGGVTVRMQAKDMEQVSLVAELHHQTGGNMAEVLDRVAEAVRERAELNRELRTLTAQARMSRWIVTALPPMLLIVINLVNPTYLSPLFETGTGNVLLSAAAVMIIGGSLVLGRIVRIEA
jgi:tight adherence protein B